MPYVRPDKPGDVKQALAEIGAPSLTVTERVWTGFAAGHEGTVAR